MKKISAFAAMAAIVGSFADEAIAASAMTASANAPSGAPLPGVPAALLVGGVGAGAMKVGKRRQRA